MDNSKASKKTIIDRIWDFFASIKLAAVIFSLIALSSIIGTIIEQGGEAEKNLQVLTKLFGASLAPSIYRISESLGFMDMYHSWWFMFFLVMFTANLVICSIERLPNRLKAVRQPLKPLPLEKFGSYAIKNEIRIKTEPSGLKDSLRNAIKQIGFNAREVSENGTTQFYSQKGAFGRLGVYATHLSIILILLGAVIGVFFGFNGFLNLPEGYTSEVAYSRKGGTAHPLGFSIKCIDFDVEYYKDKDMPKDYKSWLEVIKDGRIVKKQMIEVNSPLRYGGYTFYQSSYGMMPNPQGVFILKAISKSGKEKIVNTGLNGTFTIPGTKIKGEITDFSPALAFRKDGSTFTYNQMMTNPAIKISFTNSGKKLYSGWLLKRYPQTWDLPEGNRVEFIDYWGAQYTGLQVRKDPGVWLVYLGCLIMSAGLYSAFFVSHKKIWVALLPDGKKGSKILIAATVNKNRLSFERNIDKLTSILTKQA
ncbi:cytochrome c biogenesis protein CcsB [bacterium BMS3Abin07]|nr:cytochrome c biogenesis protein CcsB [bacterium BMS3Abin07]GBE32024.1 cytochrome c biogenesis protein CcsB [bacterium BMS3Bbin05]HDO21632.1 cytochrome c biogenesis protein ResB [Nitrospirota bacterium]HDZ88709.1 cytochrome c biogenesis protein ResB [Nitrospirota bacterium]